MALLRTWVNTVDRVSFTSCEKLLVFVVCVFMAKIFMVKVVGYRRCTGACFFVFRYIDNTKIDKKQYYAKYSTYFFIVLLTGSYHLYGRNQYCKGFRRKSPFLQLAENSVNGHFRGANGAHLGHF